VPLTAARRFPFTYAAVHLRIRPRHSLSLSLFRPDGKTSTKIYVKEDTNNADREWEDEISEAHDSKSKERRRRRTGPTLPTTGESPTYMILRRMQCQPSFTLSLSLTLL
jgi:hypothetical protein